MWREIWEGEVIEAGKGTWVVADLWRQATTPTPTGALVTEGRLMTALPAFVRIVILGVCTMSCVWMYEIELHKR